MIFAIYIIDYQLFYITYQEIPNNKNIVKYLPYKQRVTGSYPVAPTNKDKGFRRFSFGPFFSFAQNLHNYRLIFHLLAFMNRLG